MVSASRHVYTEKTNLILPTHPCIGICQSSIQQWDANNKWQGYLAFLHAATRIRYDTTLTLMFNKGQIKLIQLTLFGPVRKPVLITEARSLNITHTSWLLHLTYTTPPRRTRHQETGEGGQTSGQRARDDDAAPDRRRHGRPTTTAVVVLAGGRRASPAAPGGVLRYAHVR